MGGPSFKEEETEIANNAHFELVDDAEPSIRTNGMILMLKADGRAHQALESEGVLTRCSFGTSTSARFGRSRYEEKLIQLKPADIASGFPDFADMAACRTRSHMDTFWRNFSRCSSGKVHVIAIDNVEIPSNRA